jgi:hypothetical protein
MSDLRLCPMMLFLVVCWSAPNFALAKQKGSLNIANRGGPKNGETIV